VAQSGTTDLGANIGGGAGGVTSLSGLTGALTLVAGTGITITPSGSNITIASTGSSGISSINGDSTAAQTLSTGTAGTDFNISNPGGGSHVFNLPTASALNRGLLSSADWSAFSAKQPAGSYITALTGDGTAIGPGSVAFTLATVNGSVGSFTNANITVNAKGLITAASNGTNGTVTSVALVDSTGLFNITGSPVTTSGILTLASLQSQTANTIFSGPSSGSPASPSFRSLVAADIPTLTSTKISNFTSATQAVASASVTKKIIYVSQDVGSDSNDGSIFLPFKTIQAGINAANTIAAFYNQVIVLVSPATSSTGYNEDITLSQQGITLQASSELERSDSTLIHGSVTINLTGTSGGANFVASENDVYIKGFVVIAQGKDAIIFNGSTFQRLYLSDAYIQSTSVGSAVNMTNTGVSGVRSTITVRGTTFENNAAAAATVIVGGGRIFIAGPQAVVQNDNASGASFSITGANLAAPSITGNNIDITGQVLVSDNTATLTLSNYIIRSGSLPAIVTPSSPSTGFITIGTGGLLTTATNSITGSGVVVVGGENAKLSTGGDIVTTVTQATIPKFPEGQTLLSASLQPGATAVTNSLLIIKNGHVTSQQTTAPTIATANSGASPSVSLSSATDTAGKINYTPGAGVSAAATITITFNKAYSVAPIPVLTPGNTNAGTNAAQVFVTTTTTTMVLDFVAAPTATLPYIWYYNLIETQ
jgi:trimeric autotransporter adhesin